MTTVPIDSPQTFQRGVLWVLRRAVLGLGLMIAIAGVAAVVTDAGIDRSIEEAAE